MKKERQIERKTERKTERKKLRKRRTRNKMVAITRRQIYVFAVREPIIVSEV